MSLKPKPIDAIPEETICAAQAAFPNGNIYMTMRDEFGAIYNDEQFVALFPERGQPAVAIGSGYHYANSGGFDRPPGGRCRARPD